VCGVFSIQSKIIKRREQCKESFPCPVSKQEKKGWYALAFEDPKWEEKYS